MWCYMLTIIWKYLFCKRKATHFNACHRNRIWQIWRISDSLNMPNPASSSYPPQSASIWPLSRIRFHPCCLVLDLLLLVQSLWLQASSASRSQPVEALEDWILQHSWVQSKQVKLDTPCTCEADCWDTLWPSAECTMQLQAYNKGIPHTHGLRM